MNEGRDYPLSRALITGGLGGFGATLALQLREVDVAVTVVDSLHPGCAPFAVFKHRKELLEEAGARVILADMRTGGVMDNLLDDQGSGVVPVSGANPLPPVWFHCAAAPPPGRGQTSLQQYEDIAYGTAAPWLDRALKRGWWYFVLQHNPIVFPEDPRSYHEDWRALLEAETRLRREFFPDAIARETFGGFFFLPALVGRHQSPHTTPLKQYLQMLAGREVSLSPFDNVWNYSPMELMIEQLLLVFRAVADPDDVPDPPATVDWLAKVEDWVFLLADHIDLPRIKVRFDQSPASYLITPAVAAMIKELPEFRETGSDFVVFPPDRLQRIDGTDVEKLVNRWLGLPWVPPVDWPREVGRRGGGRRRRRS